MSKFKRRNTVVNLDIEGNVFTVDFGVDGIQGILSDVAKKTSAADTAYPEIEDAKERWRKVSEEQKTIMKGAINELLQDKTASEKIFAEDNTEIFIADVYTFIIKEYTEIARA